MKILLSFIAFLAALPSFAEGLTVLSPGPMLGRDRSVSSVRVSCSSANLAVYRTGSTGCAAGGELMSQDLYRRHFAGNGTIETCARGVIARNFATRGEGTLTIRHLGIFADRPTAGGNFSHHSEANAIDLSGVELGALRFGHAADFARQEEPNGQWQRFWSPFIECLNPWTVNVKQDLKQIEDDAIAFGARLREGFLEFGTVRMRDRIEALRGELEVVNFASYVARQVVAHPSARALAAQPAAMARFKTELERIAGRSITASELAEFARKVTSTPLRHRDHIHVLG